MKILILGSQGFIGSHIASSCITNGHLVTGCDLVEGTGQSYSYHKVSILSPDFDSLFDAENFDVCVNASGSGNVSFSITHPISDFEANTLAVVKVLDTIRKYRPTCKYVHISSAAVYGNPKKLPIHEGDELTPLSPYGYHKWVSEIICREYYHLYKIPVSMVRPFSVYGAGLKKQLLWDICQKLTKQNSISLFGTGNETRDFIHVSDLARLLMSVIEKGEFTCEVYNAASGEETSIKQIALHFEKYFPGGKTILFSGEEKKGDPVNWRADISNIKKLGFNPAISLETAIGDYVNWFHNETAG